MAMTNSERQDKWLEKNRAVFNLRRRNKRKDLIGRRKGCSPCSETDRGNSLVRVQPDQDSKKSKIEELRALISLPQPISEPESAKPLVFRNDYGQIISERAWKTLQEMKANAEKGNYVLDEYSQ